jgi:hypothetical protein
MSWTLLIQIEMIILTIGLVVMITISHWQTTKDMSRKERWTAIINGLAQVASNIKEQSSDKAVEELLKKYVSKQTDKKE